jgi:hypothetical protein
LHAGHPPTRQRFASRWLVPEQLSMAEAWGVHVIPPCRLHGPLPAGSLRTPRRPGRLKDPSPATLMCLPCNHRLQWWVENGFTDRAERNGDRRRL